MDVRNLPGQRERLPQHLRLNSLMLRDACSYATNMRGDVSSSGLQGLLLAEAYGLLQLPRQERGQPFDVHADKALDDG